MTMASRAWAPAPSATTVRDGEPVDETRPWACRARRASRTDARLTPNDSDRSRSVGSASPGDRVPAMIASRMLSATCRYSGLRLTRSKICMCLLSH